MLKLRNAMRVGLVCVLMTAALPMAATAGSKMKDMDSRSYISASFISRPEGTFDNDTGAFSGDSTARGIAIRLGGDWAGGVVFDADLMRWSAGWLGGEPAWRGPAFDGAHGPSPTLTTPIWQTPHGPGWSGPDGSLADPRPNTISPQAPPGRLPSAWAKYRGLYTHGERVIVSYSVGDTLVLETPSLETHGKATAFVRTIRVGKLGGPRTVMLVDGNPEIPQPGQKRTVGVADKGYEPNPGKPTVIGTLSEGDTVARIGDVHVAIAHAPAGAKLVATDKGTITLSLPAGAATTLKVLIAGGGDDARGDFVAMAKATAAPDDLMALTKGGPAQWPDVVETKGEVSNDDKAAYVIDRVSLPEHNPYDARMRIGAFDFFTSDPTRAALSTWRGDVWIVSGIDDNLDKLTWKRFAVGLHQPLGLKIVDDVIYTVGHDQITRLRDLNNDGEADFYECFNNDWELTTAFHAFAFDLHTDPQGNFVFAFGSPVRSGGGNFHRITKHHGSILVVTPDGKQMSVYATGLRAPNGIGVNPVTGQITSGDNEGTYVPKSPIHWVSKGEFLGVMQSAHRELSDGETPPKPLCWMPKDVDNSCGGQVWVTSDRWGPFKGELMHMSYGQSSLYLVLKEEKDGMMQGGVAKFEPLRFTSSCMRAHFNARDGQLYVSGLKGWQSNAGKEGGLDRVRFTGKPVRMPSALHIDPDGLRLTFTCKLDKELAEDTESYNVATWNYKWTGGYGSGDFDKATLKVTGAKLSDDGQTVTLKVDGIKPVMQMQIQYDLESTDKAIVNGKVYNTIHSTGAAGE
ncbi:MAG: hypothetical protein GC159_11845 [Phycisphaera sp.]|nr:hypothetical protein [Phycisphaera sp.]